jgi:hypothetical protein
MRPRISDSEKFSEPVEALAQISATKQEIGGSEGAAARNGITSKRLTRWVELLSG